MGEVSEASVRFLHFVPPFPGSRHSAPADPFVQRLLSLRSAQPIPMRAFTTCLLAASASAFTAPASRMSVGGRAAVSMSLARRELLQSAGAAVALFPALSAVADGANSAQTVRMPVFPSHAMRSARDRAFPVQTSSLVGALLARGYEERDLSARGH